MNTDNFCRSWVIFEEGHEPESKLTAGGSGFEIVDQGDGTFVFVPKTNCELPKALLKETDGEGQFEFGLRLKGGLIGDFDGVGTLLFTMNKLTTKRYVISIGVVAAATTAARASKRKGRVVRGKPQSHGGPHGVDN